mgnify:CR=1 FL=1
MTVTLSFFFVHVHGVVHMRCQTVLSLVALSALTSGGLRYSVPAYAACVGVNALFSCPWLPPSRAIIVRRAVVSTVHATCASAWCMLVGFTVTREQVETAAGALVGFLVWDATSLIVDGATTLPASTLAHHVGTIGMVFLNRRTVRLYYVFPALYIGEFSTIFLNLRIIYRTLNWHARWNGAFALSFLVSRIVCYGVVLVHLWHQRDQVIREPIEVVLVYTLAVPALYALNLFWFSKIVRMGLTSRPPFPVVDQRNVSKPTRSSGLSPALRDRRRDSFDIPGE